MGKKTETIETARCQKAAAEMIKLRGRIADLAESLGNAAGLMREAATDCEQESMESARLCADDARVCLSEAREEISALINGLYAWEGVKS